MAGPAWQPPEHQCWSSSEPEPADLPMDAGLWRLLNPKLRLLSKGLLDTTGQSLGSTGEEEGRQCHTRCPRPACCSWTERPTPWRWPSLTPPSPKAPSFSADRLPTGQMAPDRGGGDRCPRKAGDSLLQAPARMAFLGEGLTLPSEDILRPSLCASDRHLPPPPQQSTPSAKSRGLEVPGGHALTSQPVAQEGEPVLTLASPPCPVCILIRTLHMVMSCADGAVAQEGAKAPANALPSKVSPERTP